MATIRIALLSIAFALFFSPGRCDSLSSKATKLTTGLVKGTLNGTSKAGYYLVQPRHVEQSEVYGLWRLQLDDGGILNLEITPKIAILVDDGQIFRMPYVFYKAKWPIRARIEFKTKQYSYKIILHRKVAARNILKMKGKISRLGRWGGRKEVFHTFVGKRRLKLDVTPEDEPVENEVYDSEEYHESDEYDEDNGGKSDVQEYDQNIIDDSISDAECEYDEDEYD